MHYGRLFPTDDIGQRILTVLYMAFMLLMAFNIHDLTAAGSRVGVWHYGHYPFLAAITVYGVVGNKIFALDPAAPLDLLGASLDAGPLITPVIAIFLFQVALDISARLRPTAAVH